MKKTVIVTLVLAAFVAAAGCKGKKKAGDKCTGDEASCLDKTNILECHDGVLAQMTCKGAKGCSEKATGSTRSGKTVTTNFAVDCDFSAAAEGDACLDDSSQCSADNTTMVTCKAKKITLTKCLGPKACKTSPTVIDCDTSVQPAGAACEGADDVACTPDKKQMLTCTGGMLTCSFGTAPSNFVATPKTVVTSMMDAGNIVDMVPMTNIMPFAMCTSIANPTVASATAAALGVLTPMPCVPAIPAPWKPGAPTVIVSNMPALNNTSTLNCMWAGVITFTNPGQTTELVP